MSDVCKLLTLQHEKRLIFECPGCKINHSIIIGRWTWNGDFIKPTISPSILVRATVPITDKQHARIMNGETVEPIPLRCHSFVRDGKIQFLDDCSHALAGQTVSLPIFD